MTMSDEKQAVVGVSAAPMPPADVSHSAPATDIEHAGVADDPRAWSNARKVRVHH